MYHATQCVLKMLRNKICFDGDFWKYNEIYLEYKLSIHNDPRISFLRSKILTLHKGQWDRYRSLCTTLEYQGIPSALAIKWKNERSPRKQLTSFVRCD